MVHDGAGIPQGRHVDDRVPLLVDRLGKLYVIHKGEVHKDPVRTVKVHRDFLSLRRKTPIFFTVILTSPSVKGLFNVVEGDMTVSLEFLDDPCHGNHGVLEWVQNHLGGCVVTICLE